MYHAFRVATDASVQRMESVGSAPQAIARPRPTTITTETVTITDQGMEYRCKHGSQRERQSNGSWLW